MHSLSKTYDRLVSLAECIGFSVKDGTIIKALLKGYSAGFESVTNYFDNVLQEIFVLTSKRFGVSKYLELLDIEEYTDLASAKNMVVERLSKPYGTFSNTEFINAFFNLHKDIDLICTDDGVIYISGIPLNTENLLKLGNFFRIWVSPFLQVSFGSLGKKWDELELYEMNFKTFDKIGFTFNMLDTLRRD